MFFACLLSMTMSSQCSLVPQPTCFCKVRWGPWPMPMRMPVLNVSLSPVLFASLFFQKWIHREAFPCHASSSWQELYFSFISPQCCYGKVFFIFCNSNIIWNVFVHYDKIWNVYFQVQSGDERKESVRPTTQLHKQQQQRWRVWIFEFLHLANCHLHLEFCVCHLFCILHFVFCNLHFEFFVLRFCIFYLFWHFVFIICILPFTFLYFEQLNFGDFLFFLLESLRTHVAS